MDGKTLLMNVDTGRVGWLAAGLLVVGALPQFSATPLPDLAWLLYSAQRMLEGATLYRELVEVNPPLIVWLNLLPAALARALGIDPLLAYRLAVTVAAVASFLLCRAVLLHLRAPQEPAVRGLILLLISVSLVLLAGPDFGEREHLFLLSVLPYILLVAVRGEQGNAGLPLSLAVGAFAGIGIALKPYFVLLPVILEGWLLLRRGARLVRPETAAIAGIAAAYVVAAQLWAPSYWTISRTMGLAYYRFLEEPLLLTAVTGHGAAMALCAMLAYYVLRDQERQGPLLPVLLLATVALYLAAVLQRKGWRYHFYPSMASGLMLLGLLSTSRRPRTTPATRVYGAVALAITIYLPFYLLGAAILHTIRPETAPVIGDADLPALAEVVRREGPHRGLLVLSTNMASAFPLVTETGATWTSRFPSVWPLATEYRVELASPEPLRYRAPEARSPLEQSLTRAVREDFVGKRPNLLIVLRTAPDRPAWGIRRLDYLKYFAADPEFERELAHYGFLEDVGEYRIFRRLRAGESAGPPPLDSAPEAAAPFSLHSGLQVNLPSVGTVLAASVLLLLVIIAYRREPGPGR
jgi:hypothetical protein